MFLYSEHSSSSKPDAYITHNAARLRVWCVAVNAASDEMEKDLGSV